jgi:hypothetical protein
LTPAPASQATPPQPTPVVAKDDATPQTDTGKKVQDSEAKKAQDGEVKKAQDSEPGKDAAARKPERRAERHRERRRYQDVDSAANAVRQIQRDDDGQQFQRDDWGRQFRRDERVRQIQRDDGQQEVILRRYDSPRMEGPRFGFFGDD